jgi:hypothetical protein
MGSPGMHEYRLPSGIVDPHGRTIWILELIPMKSMPQRFIGGTTQTLYGELGSDWLTPFY